MKKLPLLFLTAAFVFLLNSCSLEENVSNVPQTEGLEYVSRVIPPEMAIAELESVIENIYGGTKAGLIFSADDLQVFGGVSTKAGDMVLPDTAVYVLNFPDESGYAVMAAQSCMSTPVFCVTESGALTSSDLFEALSLLESGDGAAVFDEEMFVPMMLASSAVNQYNNPVEINPEYVIIDNPVFVDYYYQTVQKIGPLLETKWYQYWPFNSYLPKNAPVGCVTIATAQILAYNEYGSTRGIDFDWDLMKTVCPYYDHSVSGLPAANQAVSDFVEILGLYDYCRIKYAEDSTGTSSGNADGAKRAFEKFGYKNVRKYLGFEKADKNRVISMLNNYYPVFAAGQLGTNSGHAWVIDGLLIRNKKRFANNELLGTENLFHINWGWNGVSDGYYNQGVFDTTKRVDVDDNIDREDSTNVHNYTWNYRTVTYSL
ncbi:MAG TPA: C10 family peptidase [Candidatus Coprenecus stercoravium]|uniref:C10 family peptidase n=1 Tax=Candidatus Coprenecus stercoravium TaxID=2840735 RepID=A0A9D2KBP0_9BACT|nr:C10 family peptidase [Candidatus Coprenecus stercoravium]